MSESDGRLGVAVRAGDAETVRALVAAGADPDVLDADGLPLLCVAVAAYDGPVAGALVVGGADPDRVLPDGSTPRWRAVDGGSPAVCLALLDDELRLRLPAATRERLLALARGWYETGAVEELRRRTGASGPAMTVRVQDDDYDWVDQVSLGGLVVRAGHGSILTSLEWAFRIPTPVDELIARAVEQPDEDHVNWSTVRSILSQRLSHETWSAVVAHHRAPDPARRRLVVDYLRLRAVMCFDRPDPYEKEESELLATWAAEETDSALLARVLDIFLGYEHPGQETIGLRHAGHPDPRVRREVPYALCRDYVARSLAARAALVTLTRDPDTRVRLSACMAGSRDADLRPDITRALLLMAEDPDAETRGAAVSTLAEVQDLPRAVADALAGMLDDDDLLVRLAATYGLARCDDPRTAEAIERLGPLPAAYEHDHRPSALWRWSRRKANPGSE
ncbi:HEAT repeat domain-containing protein [Streptomyces sp. NPDC058470]|uniref:HEAT repeat domain-containing protein n=1 Tax=Streptomyces sp. NPDC058470 TaxID=3346515 RepID=UPI003652073F